MTIDTTHPDVLKRLKRAQGHLKSIVTCWKGTEVASKSLNNFRR